MSLDSEVGGVLILPMGEEEVKVAKSEAPVFTGVWCERETLRPWAWLSGNGVLRGHRRQGP
ncbi:hypothetical protein DRB96_22135 [Streptomyces sp. ICC1]|nr:hypothetical protein DRB89_27650 [Streptomyces sp. ICC4]AWZ18162.1 hypothetical protein DRB96_22135 [Streptomyces sp. ICC1]